MKRSGDMKRRRRAAYCRGWAEAMAHCRATVERLWAEGLINPRNYNELIAAVSAEPDPTLDHDIEPPADSFRLRRKS